jgi:hypothetical protein
MEFIKRLKDRAPEYISQHKELIAKLTTTQGGQSGTTSQKDTWKQGKFFQFQYEIYMFATILGLKRNYCVPIPEGSEMNKFMEIKFWQPQDLVDYIIMGIISYSDLDLNLLEELNEQDVEKEILKLRKQMELYANGGFDIMRSKMEDDPTFFEHNENCLLDLLDEVGG